MTTAIGPARARLAVAVAPDLIALVGLTVLVGALTALTWGTWGDLGRDTGYDLVAGSRVAHGELPYLDFVYYYGPLAPALLGLAGFIGGDGVAPAVIVGLLLSSAIVAVTYALARVQVGEIGAFLAASITAAAAFSPTNLSFVLPHTSSAPLAVLGTLCFVLGLARYARGGELRWLLAAGVAAGAVSLTRPEFELAVAAAAGLWLVLRSRAFPANRLREGLALVGPALLIPSAVYGAFLTVVPAHRLFLENLYPVDQLRAAGNAVLRIHAPLTASSFVALGGRLVLYAAGVVALLIVGRALASLGAGMQALTLGLAGAALAAASIADPEALRTGLQYAYGWIPAGAAIALGVSVLRARRRSWRWDAAAQAELAVAAALAVLAAKDYAAFYLWATRAQPAVYAAPLAVLLLVRLHLVELSRFRLAVVLGTGWLAFLAAAGVGLTLKDGRAESDVVRGPGGTIAATPEQARLYRAALRWIATETRPGEPILLAPQNTALYVLADRRDPLPQLSLVPGALPRVEDERAAITRLRSEKVRLAITDRHVFTEYGQTSFGKSFDRVLADWITRRFTHLATLTGGPGAGDHILDVWLRRNS